MQALCLQLCLLQLVARSLAFPGGALKDASGNRWRSLSCYYGNSTSCDCSGSNDGKTKILSSNPIQRLRNQYENCTRVWGNLEITFIDRAALDQEKVDPDEALKFLESIEEVTGYVFIYSNDVSRISLPKLRIIWADTVYYDTIKQSANLTFADPQDGVSFFVFNNPNLQYIDMPELRSIERGKIVAAHNNHLCYWQQLADPSASTIDFGQLVGKSNVASRLHDFHTSNLMNFEMCNRATDLCHPNCTSGHCWGPGANMCQIIYRSNCPSSCEAEMCSKPGEEPQLCCHKACAAGCYGPRHDQCYACKSLEQDGACVEKCNGLRSYNHATGMTEPHTDPRYTYKRTCVKQCPENTLIQGEHCVTRCNERFYADAESNDRICRECQGACPKRCTLNDELTSEHIDELINCTIIEGRLVLLQHVMTNFSNFDDTVPRKIRAMTMDDLEKLSHVRVITDYLEIQMGVESPQTLNFLRNLKIIEGRRLSTARYAMLISSNDNLYELGLTSLKHVRKGHVYVGKNSGLCYADSINWEAIIEQRPTLNGEGVYKIQENKSPKLCERQNAVCDTMCNKTMGCWGGGDRQCFACANWRIGNQCVNSCPESGYYKVYDTRECMPCHAECEKCTGEGSRNCTSCKKVSLFYNTSNFECLSECPLTHYEKGSQCQPCHQTCFENGCSGPDDVPGEGGCKMCRFAEISQDDTSVVRCLPAPTDSKSEGVCAAAGLTNYFRAAPKGKFVHLVDQYVCERCDPVCSECSGYGKDVVRHNCKCVSYKLEGSTDKEEKRCVDNCPTNSFMIKEKQGGEAGVCKTCHPLCDPHAACTGNMSTDCQKCKEAGIQNDGKFECLEECPVHAPFKDNDLFCYSEDRMAIRQGQKKRNTIVIGGVIAAFVIGLLVLAMVAFIFRSKYKKEAKYNAPPIPELDPIHPGAEPNMTRLHLISADQLSRSPNRLGSGAFGIVYGGYWWPEGSSGRKVPVAIKVVQETSGKAQQEMLTEAGIMAGMRHPHLLRLVGVCLSDGLQLITPLRPLGNLLEFVQKHKQKLGSLDLMRYSHQIASAMEFLEQNRLVHRDLACRNVLVKTTFHVEVTDFGLAKMLDYGESEVYVEGKVAVKWLALECLLERRFTHASDVWAFGVTVWEILTFGQSPYPGVQLTYIKDFLKNGNRLSQPENCTQELYQLMLQCWMEKETARPTFIELADTFSKMLRKPQIYILDRRHRPQRMESFNQRDQRGLINDLLQDSDANFVDPLQYFDDLSTNDNESTSRTTPDTPTSPESSTKPLMPRNHHRLQSTGSSRYQSDPLNRPKPMQSVSQDMPGSSKQQYNLATDDGNYLVPNIRSPSQNGAVAYTPVVVRENGETDVARPGEYYNENLAKDGALLLKAVDNREYMTGGRRSPISESETTV